MCDPEDGCTVPKTVCSEDDDCPALLGGCLIGTCDLRVATCFYNALDRDGDGHPVQTCEKIGGDDCHDTDPEIYPGASEICDGEDNDCNSETDDILPQTCGSEVGECQTGTRACEDGEWSSSCVGEIAPRAETCDERDNDCDGEVDEGLLNRCGTCGPIPVEVCDGEDNDCDGSVDEGLLNACGECGPVPTEFCDGEDNDCDGRVDEDFGVYDSRTGRARGLGYSCGVGYGECLNIGEVICSADGSSAHCSVNPLPNESPEVCDRRDNDCDGEVDEDASPEVCDGLDNDCDGWPDESIFDPFPVCCGNGSCEPGDCGVLDCHWCPEECSPTACIEAMDGCEAESESEAEPESGAE
ncbi:putative metal-binding motif-containing protein [Candidatus Uhrbacteria bacterium]|nr:putative metal-binding motif-containing protein [Candidatus Uhrbacteria bacterium]